MERKSYVYKITCKITGDYYFGSSFNAKSDKYWGSGRKIKERIAKYGKESFVKEILGEFNDRVDAHKVENEYIEKFRNDDKCLNQQLDHKFETYSDKTRAKISAANLGEKNPMCREEIKAKIGAAHRGMHHTEETKQKIRESNRGRTPWNKGKKNCYSDETKLKIHNSLIGNIPWNKGKKLNITPWNKGKKLNEETKQKIRESLIGRAPVNKGKKLNKETGKYE